MSRRLGVLWWGGWMLVALGNWAPVTWPWLAASVSLPGRTFANSAESACVIGLRKKVVAFSPVTELKKVTDFE